jgi:hypothetical protein
MTLIQFTPDGRGRCLYTEAIDLAGLGRLTLKRASRVEFNAVRQLWEVQTPAPHGQRRLLYSDASRQRCLEWERDFFNEQLHVSLD